MEITLTVNGKPVKATVDDKEIREAMGEKQEKRTGYECRWDGYAVTEEGDVADLCFQSDELCEDSDEYQTANFYTDKKVAENNARADALMRKLRRFAAETMESMKKIGRKMGIRIGMEEAIRHLTGICEKMDARKERRRTAGNGD